MSLDERVSDLIKRIYCAGDDSAEWNSVAEDVLYAVGAHAGLATITDFATEQLGDCRFFGKETTNFARGIDEYSYEYKNDPSLKWGAEHLDARFCDSADTLPAAEYLTNPYVKWNLARFGSTHWYVGYTKPELDLSFSFSVHFPAAVGPGTADSLRLFRMLFDHMECAVRLRRRPFNHSPDRAVLIIDAKGYVRQSSLAADQLLSGKGALKLINKQLQTSIPAEQHKLDQAMSRVASLGEAGAIPAAVKILHPLGKRPWIITFRPMLAEFGPFGQPRYGQLVEIHDAIPRIGSIAIMQSLFDLTPRELEVARLIADGHSIESLSRQMGISENTTRAHLRALFLKTSTTRQSELVQLCAGLSER